MIINEKRFFRKFHSPQKLSCISKKNKNKKTYKIIVFFFTSQSQLVTRKLCISKGKNHIN